MGQGIPAPDPRGALCGVSLRDPGDPAILQTLGSLSVWLAGAYPVASLSLVALQLTALSLFFWPTDARATSVLFGTGHDKIGLCCDTRCVFHIFHSFALCSLSRCHSTRWLIAWDLAGHRYSHRQHMADAGERLPFWAKDFAKNMCWTKCSCGNASAPHKSFIDPAQKSPAREKLPALKSGKSDSYLPLHLN